MKTLYKVVVASVLCTGTVLCATSISQCKPDKQTTPSTNNLQAPDTCLKDHLQKAASSTKAATSDKSKTQRIDILLVKKAGESKVSKNLTLPLAGVTLRRRGVPVVSPDKPAGLKVAGSLVFDGKSQYHVSRHIMQPTNCFSLEVWAKAKQANHKGLHVAVAHGDGRGGYLLAQQNDQWVCFVGGKGGVVFGKVTADQWEHLKITVKDGILTLFRNDKKVKTSYNVFKPSPNFSIGGIGGHDKEAFIGAIAAVSFSSKKVTPAPYINTWQVSDARPAGSVKSGSEIKNWHYFDDRLFSRNYDDYQDLRSYITVLCKQKADTVEMMARTFVFSPKAVEGQLRMGADNECDAWLNSQKIGGSSKSNPDRDSLKWPVKLKKGWNNLKVRIGNRKDGRLGFYARLTNLDGGAIDGLIISPEKPVGQLRIATQAMSELPTTTLPAAWREWPYVGMEPLKTVSPARFPIRSRRAHGSEFVLNAAGGKAPYSWTITKGKVPAGITLKTSGEFSGTVSSEAKLGEYKFTVSVTDTAGTKVEKELSIKLHERPNRRVERQRLIGLIHRPEHAPVNSFDELAEMMKRQGYQMGIPIGYNNGKHAYRWPTKTGFRPLNPRFPDAKPMGDVITPCKKALLKQGLDFGFYMGNFNGKNHGGVDGMVRVFEEVMDTFQPKLIWLDWAGWQGTSLDAVFSAVRARDPECVLLVNQAQANRFGNGDWDLTCMEGWGAWAGSAWRSWPYKHTWPKKHAMETWRCLPAPNYECTRGIKCDWRRIMKVTISLICEGHIADIDQTPTAERKNGYISDRLDKLSDSHVMQVHMKMGDWANPKGLPVLYTSYTNCDPGPVQGEKWGYSTISADGKTVYLHVMKNPRGKTGMPKDGKLILKNYKSKIKSATCMNNGKKVPFSISGKDIIIDASGLKADQVDTIIELK